MPKKQMQIRASDEQLKRWQEAAAVERRTISDAIRLALDDWADGVLGKPKKKARPR